MRARWARFGPGFTLLVSFVAMWVVTDPGLAFAQLNLRARSLKGSGDSWKFEVGPEAVVMVTVSGRVWSDGSDRSSASIHINVDGNTCAEDQSYVPSNWAVEHKVSATCIEHLKKGSHDVKVWMSGEGLKKESTLWGRVVLIETK
jgi:hypothetical protein